MWYSKSRGLSQIVAVAVVIVVDVVDSTQKLKL